MITKTNRAVLFLAAVALAGMPVLERPVEAQQLGGIAFTKTAALTATNASCTATACVSMPVTSQTSAVGVQITGTFTATMTFEASVDGSTWVAVAAVPPAATATRVTTATAAGLWQINVTGYTAVRARCSAYTSGTINVTLNRSQGHSHGGV